ncbi:hypothetical protein BUALT_Bualt12G0133100 [Buddleja alternifolia]|uniref:Uncharacterized protein n=1 Tax=Buddleja alternifolia TaxID=168488 RepID=A0AAV6WPX0_9LAMI|nr:hypothetical protein BUALT_Bualt12G0133100 [Buddleja alternifolia]
MGDALFDLEQVLRSRKEQLTLQEANILLAWRAQAMRDFTVGFGGGSIVTWLATKRLSNLFRLNLTFGAAAACGLWKFGRSVESSVERVLALEGSRIQSELANILLKRYYTDPLVLQRLSKHFYSEEVYEDSSVDKPVFRWRFRNFSGDPGTNSQSTSSYSEEVTDSKKNEVKKTTNEPKQVYVNAAGGSIEDPFDFVFGFPGVAEDIPHPDTPSGTSSRRHIRREKRSRRRHRRHNHEEEPDI